MSIENFLFIVAASVTAAIIIKKMESSGFIEKRNTAGGL